MGGSMRSGNRLGGLLAWALAATMGVAVEAQTSEQVTSIPLGGKAGGESGDRYFGVYIPTRFGGELTIKASSGQVVELKGPRGQALSNGKDIGVDREGWVTFKVKGAKPSYSVETT